MGQPVVHFEINGKDGPKLQKFYADAFGWKIQDMPEMNYGMVEAEEGGIAGGIGQTEDSGEQWVTFYIQVDDPQEYLDKVTAMGGSVVQPVMEIPDVVTFAVFADPEGNKIGLVKA